ncbi:MAG: hypothetical protein F4X20_08110 [Dehalococcoidia bacterium]|nr:hypothetical protein [Dehalococcoidia bacterium]
MDLSGLLYVVGAVGVVLIGLVAFRFIATFDLNKWQERKDKKMQVRLMNACPHYLVTLADNDGKGDVKIQPLYVTTYGTTDWFCTQCRTVFPGGLILPQKPRGMKEVEALIKQQEEFQKLARKAGVV